VVAPRDNAQRFESYPHPWALEHEVITPRPVLHQLAIEGASWIFARRNASPIQLNLPAACPKCQERAAILNIAQQVAPDTGVHGPMNGRRRARPQPTSSVRKTRRARAGQT